MAQKNKASVRKKEVYGGGHFFCGHYFIKDQLGNTRMVLTEEHQRQIYPAATLETNAIETEKLYYQINPAAVVPKPVSLNADYPNNNGILNPGNNNAAANSTSMYKLNAATGDKMGLGIMLKVMSGDTVSILGKSFWHNNAQTNPNHSYQIPLNDLLLSLLNVSKVVNFKGITIDVLNNQPITTQLLQSLLNKVPQNGTAPKAYINWILLDEQLKPVENNSSFDPVDNQADVLKTHTRAVNINRNGYLYVYVSNQSNLDVFFDNLQVVHSRGALLEETHYYPFGLTMAGISSKAAGKMENKHKFNEGTELTADLGLEWYETEFRSYDAQIGRFHQIDPLTEFSFNWSGYSFVQNNPILFNDPYGLDTLRRNADGSLPTVRVDGSKLQDVDIILGENGQVENYYNGESWQAPSESQVTVTSSSKKKEENPISKTPWMDKALSKLGEKEDKRLGKHNPEIIKFHSTTGKWKNDEVPWCASFVNWCFVESNIPSLNSARAFDYKNFGVKLNQPAYGALVIMNYSHVGFVAGQNSDGRIVVLGGNQGDEVNYSPNAVSAVLQYRYPIGFKPNYNLPAFKLRGRSLTGNTSR